LLAFEKRIGIEHVCIVAISVYGEDNRLLLQALRQLKGRGRGVVSIDAASITDAELDEMHALGVRGVRLNLRTVAQKLGEEAWAATLSAYAERVRRLDWVLQCYVYMDQIALIAPMIPKLGLRVVFDHLGDPQPDMAPRAQAGYAELVNLLQTNSQVYVKLSGTYRLTGVPELDSYAKELLRIAPTQIVWASDWPHTGGTTRNPDGDPKKPQDFLQVDIPAFAQQCMDWCDGNEHLLRQIWVDNPRRLWDYHG
jgi:predicted TIM-barrel fold metal-dependent hydrolase